MATATLSMPLNDRGISDYGPVGIKTFWHPLKKTNRHRIFFQTNVISFFKIKSKKVKKKHQWLYQWSFKCNQDCQGLYSFFIPMLTLWTIFRKSQGFIIPNFISKIEDKKYEVFMHALLWLTFYINVIPGVNSINNSAVI